MCFSAQAPCTRDAIVTDGLHSGAGKPRTLGAAAEDAIQAPVDDFLAKGKVHTHCLPGARVLDVSVQIPAILKDDESVAAVVIHAGANDTKLRQTETLKRDFRSLIETVRSTSPAATIIVSGPLPTYRRGHEKFSRLFALNE